VRVVLETLITFSTADQWTSFYESRPYPLVLDPLDILEMVCHLPYKKHSCNRNLTQCLSLVHSFHTCIGSTNMARLLHCTTSWQGVSVDDVLKYECMDRRRRTIYIRATRLPDYPEHGQPNAHGCASNFTPQSPLQRTSGRDD
jgi:hypothetical protein